MIQDVLSDTATGLALGSVLVAILSAFYANRSAVAAQRQAHAAEAAVIAALEQVAVAQRALEEARRQSSISVHGRQLDIYEALLQFQRERIGNRQITTENVGRLWDIARNADFYFSKIVDRAVLEMMFQAGAAQHAQVRYTQDASLMPIRSYEVSDESISIVQRFDAALETCLSAMRKEIKGAEG
jgi:hypothetical protein